MTMTVIQCDWKITSRTYKRHISLVNKSVTKPVDLIAVLPLFFFFPAIAE